MISSLGVSQPSTVMKPCWQPLCAPCHSRKTATEDGGFGNRWTGRESSG